MGDLSARSFHRPVHSFHLISASHSRRKMSRYSRLDYGTGPSARQQILPPGYDTLPYTDRVQEQWSREFDPTRLHRNEIAGGPLTHSYENLVKNIFRPEQTSSGGFQGGTHALPPSFAPPASAGGGQTTCQRILGVTDRPKISATAMRRIEAQLGKDAIDDTYDDQLWKSPLDEIYAELGIDSPSLANMAISHPAFSVYNPKSSSEYFSTVLAPPSSISSTRSSTLGTYRLGAPSSLRSPPISSSSADEDRWRHTDRQTLLDYKDTYSQSPFSAHLYQGGVQRQDSRIVGSNFVQLTTRPRDRFLEKLDKTLADIRAEPRY